MYWKWRKQEIFTNRIQKIEILEYSQMYICVGGNEEESQFWFMKIFKGQTDGNLDIRLTSAPLTREDTVATLDLLKGDTSLSGTLDNRIYFIRKLINCYGIVGFVRFLGPFYIIVITKRTRVANIGPCGVYKIDGIEMIPLGPLPKDPSIAQEEDKYKKLFLSVDLTVNFYFSYGYDLTSTLQYNLAPVKFNDSQVLDKVLGYRQAPRDKYMWNAYLIQPLLDASSDASLNPGNQTGGRNVVFNASNHDWILCIIHGFISQIKLEMGGLNLKKDKNDEHYSSQIISLKEFNRNISDSNLNEMIGDSHARRRDTIGPRRPLLVTVIARRSRAYAGTRFNKRGSNCQGDVANEVELEQIVGDTSPSNFAHGRYSSFVQIRGSVPLLWSQTAPSTKNLSFKTKPEIHFDSYDPCYVATGKHFMGLLSQYGSPLIVFNLVKKREAHQENRLTSEFRKAINYLNQFMPYEHKLRYFHLDMSALSKQKGDSALDQILECAKNMIDMCGIFYTGKPNRDSMVSVGSSGSEHDFFPTTYQRNDEGNLTQTGIVRVNCVDCLDRTNTAQFALGLAALCKQLQALGVTNRTELTYDMQCVRLLEDVYDNLGDTIALQYGSSYLVHRISSYRGRNQSHPGTRLTPTVQSISRYYNNTFSDKEKQEAINVFLGVYKPFENITLKHNMAKMRAGSFTNRNSSSEITPSESGVNISNQVQSRDSYSYGEVNNCRSFERCRLPLWELESDYSFHHEFDTSITAALKPNQQWYDFDIVKHLPRAAEEVNKNASSCCILDFEALNNKRSMELGSSVSSSSTGDDNSNSPPDELIDWFWHHYRPYRLTVFDNIVKLHKHSVAVDNLILSDNQTTAKHGAIPDFTSTGFGGGGSFLARNSTDSNMRNFVQRDSWDNSSISTDDINNSRTDLSTMPSVKKHSSLNSLFQIPAFTRSSRSNLNDVRSSLLAPQSPSRFHLGSSHWESFTESDKNHGNGDDANHDCLTNTSAITSKKTSLDDPFNLASMQTYGFKLSKPSAECSAIYENYVNVGKRAGVFKSEYNKVDQCAMSPSEQRQRKKAMEQDSCQPWNYNTDSFGNSAYNNEEHSTSPNTVPNSVFTNNKSNFTKQNSSCKEIELEKPSEADMLIYKNYIDVGKTGAKEVPLLSQRRYKSYSKQKYDFHQLSCTE